MAYYQLFVQLYNNNGSIDFNGILTRPNICRNEISHTPSQPCGVTIYTVSTALYLFLLRGLVACLTIPCPSYCICRAIKPFLYTTCWHPFHSTTTLSDCIPFKDTTIYFISIGYHHHVMPPARISLTLSRNFSLSFITSSKSSGLQPVSSQSCCM